MGDASVESPGAAAVDVAIDTGGTFTDLVARATDGRVERLKVPSTPRRPADAVEHALSALRARWTGAMSVASVRQGSTVATNALLERRGAQVVLVTNDGFTDILRLRRQNRPQLYALHPGVAEPLVPPELCLGMRGRCGPEGQEWEPVENVEAWIESHRSVLGAADAIAISFLHAYANAEHERAVARAMRAAFPDTVITASHELAPVFREYERTSTTVVNAYVAPVMARFIDDLERTLAGAACSVMSSTGGLMAANRARSDPVHTVLSGPAGGVRGAWSAGVRCARRALLTLDMGGTSADVSVVSGDLVPEDDGVIAEHPLRIPLLPIETVGAGGGSIAWVDRGGALQVGPHSAGADPGPACYGAAGADAAATVTDAHVVLGRIPHLLGGEMALDAKAAYGAVERIARDLHADVEDAARAIIAVAEATMARALKRVSMERGVDPRTLTLVAFGGAGGLHACALADELGCPDVLFPGEPGVLSAEGVLDAPAEAHATRSVFWNSRDWRNDDLVALIKDVQRDASRRLSADHSVGNDTMKLQTLADCRYRGQTFTLPVAVDTLDAENAEQFLRNRFNALHIERYGYALDTSEIELVAVRAYARAESESAPTRETRTPPGEKLTGPRAYATYGATLWIPEGWRGEILAGGDVLCTRTDPDAQRTVRADALALEVHHQRLASIAEEMGAALMRSAFSANIKERRDFSCAIFDAAGAMLAHAAHIPVHLGSTPLSVRAAIDTVPMRRGDSVIVNDPFAGGTHLPDVTIVTPVFLPDADAPAFYVANRGHHADVGGVSHGSLPVSAETSGTDRALTIDDEGVRLPPTLLTDDVRKRFAAASRTPDERLGDLRAQEAANRVGAARLQECVTQHGAETIAALNAELLDYTEKRMRAVIEEIPDGRYDFTDYLDDDGVGHEPVPVPVSVTINGAGAIIDFTRAGDVLPSSLNAVRAIALSTVFYVFRCLGEEHMPSNAGLMRPLEVLTRAGSFIDADYPAAVSAGNVETSQRLVDALLGALAQALPDTIPAASCGGMNNVLFGGINSRASDARPFVHYETIAGGAGASSRGPGADAVHTHMTNTLNTPVEALEHAYPVRILEYAVRDAATQAKGEHAGGAGVRRRYWFDADVEVSVISERRRTFPWGLNGAADGARGVNAVRRPGGAWASIGGKARVELPAGSELRIDTPGGGAWRPRAR